MVECPTCKKEINELDERCPYCNTIFEDMIEETEEIKENIKIEKENEECKVVDISILAASPFACNAIVEKAFCLAYKEQEESY